MSWQDDNEKWEQARKRAGLPELDDFDRGIIAERARALRSDFRPKEGDYVEFADGVTRRIAYVWRFDANVSEWQVQTADGGSFYLGSDYASYSGSLFKPVKGETLTRKSELRKGRIWIFHHGEGRADNGVESEILFRVWTCSEPAPRY